MENIQIEIDEWTECYPSKWKGLIVPEAMSHPAKFSRPLLRRIYQHAQQAGWIQPGHSVVDPFGGVALGALDAMRLGLHWTGIELEDKFAALGSQNIDLWNGMYAAKMPAWGTARLLCGDSRKLLSVIGQQDLAVSSPPYVKAPAHGGRVSEIDKKKGTGGDLGLYGEADGQLGAMKDSGFDLALSSPPFLQSQGGTPEPKPNGGSIDKSLYARHAAGNKNSHGYGKSEGQLSSMDDDGFDLALSSPPYSGNMQVEKNDKGINLDKQYESYKKSGGGQTIEQFRATQEFHSRGYGTADGNLGNASGDSFWLAAREIVDQVHLSLKPGGHAIFVVKGYVKNKTYIDFPDQWRRICEAAGFVTLHEHHALLVHAKQHMLDGGIYNRESKSFFRRLAEKKGSPRVDFETVFCMEKMK